MGGDSLSTYIENPNTNGKYKSVLIVILSEKDGEYSFSRVILDEFRTEFGLYLYKKGAPNGTDATPTSKLAGNLEKTFQNRFIKWFENYDSYDISDEEKETLKKMKITINDQRDKMLPYEITIKKRANKVLNKFDHLNHEAAVIISDRINELSIDPYTPRPMMDISPIAGSNPRKYRIRIGAQTRIEYTVDDLAHIVDVVDIIITKRRNTDYRI